MKLICLSIIGIISCQNVYPQFSGSIAYESKVYSYNKKYFIESKPFDGEFPTNRGESFVCDSSGMAYKINRSFDIYPDNLVQTAISNDGKMILYASGLKYYKNFTDEEGLDYQPIIVYKEGSLYKSYSLKDFTGCDAKIETCSNIFYHNYDIIDKEKSGYNIVFKEGVLDEEKFLFYNYFININDTVYITDSKKMTTLYDLHRGKIIEKTPFNKVYDKIKSNQNIQPEFTKIEIPTLYIDSLTNINSGEMLSGTIERLSGYRFIPIKWNSGNDYFRYGTFRISLSGYLTENGRFQISKIECDQMLPKQKIIDYINTSLFKADKLSGFSKLYIDFFTGGYTYFDEKKALGLKIKQDSARKKKYEMQSTWEYIDDVYIHKNLEDCMLELDKILNFESKKRLGNANSNFDFNGHIGGLGMWIRNNWGLHQESRLYKYFINNTKLCRSSFYIGDAISGTIISCYMEWIMGNKKICEQWLEQNKLNN